MEPSANVDEWSLRLVVRVPEHVGDDDLVIAVATFDCRVNAIHDAGDHKIIVADVLGHTHDESRQPLIYVRGGFHGST